MSGSMAYVDGFLLCWYGLTALSVLWVIWDLLTNTPTLRVMAFAWVLVILFTGPIGLFFFFLSCRQPFVGSHDQYIAAHWKQTLGSEIHCVAGDALAVLVAAAVLHYFTLPNGTEAIVEYVAAWLFGLLVFQALFMRSMFPSYGQAVIKSLFAETVSMNLVMVGMLPTVLLIKYFFPVASDPARPYFWAMMSVATLLGFVIAYPINSWLVQRGVKHGMMTRSQKGDTMIHHHHEPATLSPALTWWTVLWTYVLLIGVFWVLSLFVPVRF